MARRRTPNEWQMLLDNAGLGSLRRLAEESLLSVSAVARVVHGDSSPNPETIAKLAAVLRVPESTIYELTHGHGIEVRKWEPPAEVNRLSKRSQDAITEMIRALVAEQEQREDVVGNARSTAPITQAGEDQPAHDDELAARRTPHRRRRAGHDPEWDQMYGHQEAAHDGIPGEEIGQDHTDAP